MSEENVNADNNDEKVDAFAATAIITIVVGTVVYWLSGMPI